MVACLQRESAIGIAHGVLLVVTVTDYGTYYRVSLFVHYKPLQSVIRAFPFLVRDIAVLYDNDIILLADYLERMTFDDGFHGLFGSLSAHVDRHLEFDVIIVVLDLLASLLLHLVQGRGSLLVDKRQCDPLDGLCGNRRSQSEKHEECHTPYCHDAQLSLVWIHTFSLFEFI